MELTGYRKGLTAGDPSPYYSGPMLARQQAMQKLLDQNSIIQSYDYNPLIDPNADWSSKANALGQETFDLNTQSQINASNNAAAQAQAAADAAAAEQKKKKKKKHKNDAMKNRMRQ